MLAGRVLGTGLGLGALRLRLLVREGSVPVEVLAEAGLKLPGRVGLRAAAAAGLAAAAGGWATMVAIMGLTNMP